MQNGYKCCKEFFSLEDLIHTALHGQPNDVNKNCVIKCSGSAGEHLNTFQPSSLQITAEHWVSQLQDTLCSAYCKGGLSMKKGFPNGKVNSYFTRSSYNLIQLFPINKYNYECIHNLLNNLGLLQNATSCKNQGAQEQSTVSRVSVV